MDDELISRKPDWLSKSRTKVSVSSSNYNFGQICTIQISQLKNWGLLSCFVIYVSFMSYSTCVELRNCSRTMFTIFWLAISYRGNPNRKQSILAQKSQQVIYTMIFYQYSNAVCSKVNKVRWQFLSSTRIEYDMKDTLLR